MNGFCMSRIDRIYISAKLKKFGTNVEIIASSAYFDHMLVKLTLVRQRRPARECNLRISRKLFDDEEVRRKIRSIWERNLVGGGAIDQLQGKIIETTRYLHIETKNRISRSKEEEIQLRRTTAAQRLL